MTVPIRGIGPLGDFWSPTRPLPEQQVLRRKWEASNYPAFCQPLPPHPHTPLDSFPRFATMPVHEIEVDCVLFDMDGTLIDSTPAVNQTW